MTASMETAFREDDRTVDDDRVGVLAAEVADAVQRHLSGDATAMADLVRRATPLLRNICRGYRLSTHTAEDVVQNTLLMLTLHVRSLREPHSALAWLAVIARREAVRAIRMERRMEPVGDMTTLDSEPNFDDPERAFEAKVLRSAIDRGLAKLSPQRRELLRLVFLTEVKGYAMIADTLGIPIGSIGPTRRRSLERMRELLCADDEWGLGRSA
jgi:RNA polymerase sigma factor (sigma-70 family)